MKKQNEIHLIKSLDGKFTCANDSDLELSKKIKVGEMYKYKFSKPRNVRFHRKFFALINLVYQNQEHYNNIDQLRYDLTIESGFYETRVNHITKEPIIEAKSISFASMDEVEFSSLYSKFLDTVVRVFGWDGEDIEENIAEFM